MFALWQRPGWLFQGGQRALARGVIEFLAVVAGEAGVVSLVGHDSEQGGGSSTSHDAEGPKLFLRKIRSYFSQPVPPCLCPSLTMRCIYAIMSRVRSGCF